MKPVVALAPLFLILALFNLATLNGADQDEADAVVRLVQESQRAGFEKHEFDKYIAIWSDDAKITMGRSEKPDDAHDTTYTRAQIEATRRARFRAEPPKDVKLTFANVRPEVEGDRAVVRYRSTYRSSAEMVEETYDEVFRLRKKDGSWKVFENRALAVETRYGDKVTRYSAETWKALDAEVKKQEERGDTDGHVVALLDAWRFKEAHAAAKKWTDQAKGNLDAWVLRGVAAMSAGDAADSLASFDKALTIDAKAVVPDYVRAAKKNK